MPAQMMSAGMGGNGMGTMGSNGMGTMGGNGMGTNVSQICQPTYKYPSDVNQGLAQVMVISNIDQVRLNINYE